MNTIWFYPPGSELQKAGATGYAEPNFFYILCQICPVFRQSVTKFYKTLPNITYFTDFTNLLQNVLFTQIFPQFWLFVIYFLAIYVSPKRQGWKKTGL